MNRKTNTPFIWLSLFLLISINSYGQQLQLIDSTSIPTPSRASIDQLGHIYISDENGNIHKYDNEGKVILQYSPQQLSEISLIEAWNPLKVFIYYQNFQEFIFLDRFLTATSRFSTSDYGSYIGIATISTDNNIWCIDYSDFSLKKYDINLNQLLISSPLNLILDSDDYDIRFIREYQNLLFIADYRSGIFVFDNMGNYLRKIEQPNIDYFSFGGSDIYICIDNQVKVMSLYGEESKSFSFQKNVSFAFFYQNKLAILTEYQLKRYKILQKK